MNVQYSQQSLFAGLDMNVSSTSSAFSIKQTNGYAIQHVWSAGSTSRSALIQITGSNDQNGVFSIIDSYNIVSANGDRLINVEFPRYNYVQVIYTVITPGGGILTSDISTRES